MPDNIFEVVFLTGLIVYYVLFTVHRWQNKQSRITDRRLTGIDALLMILAFIGDTLIPLLYLFTPWLDFVDYHLPIWAGWVGAALFAAALWLVRRSHADLGRNWSPMLQIRHEHSLVTHGVYRYVRHPIYAAIWLSGVAQALLLQNWIAGLARLAFFLPVYLHRVPREEYMMLEHFGEAYHLYRNQTGRVIPQLWK